MDPKIRNFNEIKKLIKEDPKRADELAFEWSRFLKTNAIDSPELFSIETSDEFHKWTKEHPEKHIDPSVFVGKEIAESYYYLRDQHEDMQMQKYGNVDKLNVPTELAALPLLAASFLERPKIIEDDKDYQKIEERLKKEWLKKNNLKDFNSKEGLDYLYGRVNLDPLHAGASEELTTEERSEKAWAKSVRTDLPSAHPTLSQDAEKEFRSNPKFAKRVERYDKEKNKTYKNREDDPSAIRHEQKANEHILARQNYFKNTNPKVQLRAPLDEIARLVRNRASEEFLEKYSEKANYYNSQEKKKEEKSQPSLNSRILRKFLQSEENSSVRTIQGERSIVRGLGRGTNSIGRGATRVGARVASRAGRLAIQGGKVAAQLAVRAGVALLSTPVGWVIIAVVVVVVITFIIIFSVANR